MVHTIIDDEPEEDRCNCERNTSIPSLDTYLKIENGKIDIDLYKKKTERNQYLLPASCHPKTTTESVLFSLSLRIIRICSKPENRDKRLTELKELLAARNYHKSLIDISIEKNKKNTWKRSTNESCTENQENRRIQNMILECQLSSQC